MLKVVVVVDKYGSAIDRMAQGIKLYMDNIDYKIVAVHPKRPDPQQLADFEAATMDADIIDYQYFRTAEALRNRYPWLKDKPSILAHHNPYSIHESNWNDYDVVVANNKSIYEELGTITEAPVEYIGNAIDTDFWTYSNDWQPNQNVLMVAARIEGKKGILPVATVCADIGLNFHIVGSVSDPNYIFDIGQTKATFHEQISDEALRDLYHRSTIVVCNSVDNFESGPNPVLEAMACGVPVLTRNVGHIPEINNGSNMVVHDNDPEDVLKLADLLRDMLFDKKKLQDMREQAWQTVKTRNFERRAYQYQKLYRQVLHPNSRTVSVVVPIYEGDQTIRKCLDAVANQTYQNIELIVADDNPQSNRQLVQDFAQFVNFPVRYHHNASADNDYGLARARNLATIEATGEIMVYIDQRQIPEPDLVEEFVKHIKPRYWLFGNKGANKREFVENVSSVLRRDIIIAGLFSERCDKYGALSQETRTRVRFQGMKTEYIASAKATPTGKSSNRNRKRAEIIKSKNMLFKLYESIE